MNEIGSPQMSTQDCPALGIYPVNLEDLLGDVQADRWQAAWHSSSFIRNHPQAYPLGDPETGPFTPLDMERGNCGSRGIATYSLRREALSREPERGRNSLRVMSRSSSSGRMLPLLPRLGPEQVESTAGDEVALKIERVVDCGVGGQETLG